LDEPRPKDLPDQVDNLVITCIDHRFQRAIARLLKDDYNVDIERSDRISYPGASKAVADGSLISAIQTSHRLHGIKNVWLFDHTDCGGFGGLKSFGQNEQKEAGAHFGSLDKAKQAINRLLPDLKVTAFTIGLDGKIIARQSLPAASGQ
jgi:carbonic anhydrase